MVDDQRRFVGEFGEGVFEKGLDFAISGEGAQVI